MNSTLTSGSSYSFQELIVNHLANIQSFLEYILSDKFQATLDINQTINIDPDGVVRNFLSSYMSFTTTLIAAHHSGNIKFDYLTFLKDYVQEIDAILQDTTRRDVVQFKNKMRDWILSTNVIGRKYVVEDSTLSEL